MPYLRRLPSGRWRAEIRDPAGRKFGATFPRKVDARAWGQEQESLLRRGRVRDPRAGRMLLVDYEPGWWAARVVEATTAATDRGRLDRHVLSAFGAWPLELVTPTSVQGWVRQLVRDGLSPATARSCFHLLSSLLEAAHRDGLIPDNPCRSVALPPAPSHREVFLTREEVAAVGERLEPLHRSVLLTLAYTGMRWGEVAGLHAGRLDLDAARVDVVETLTEVAGDRRVKPYPKGRARRTVPLPPLLVSELAGHLDRHPAGRGQLVFRPAPVGALSRHTWGSYRFRPAVRAALGRDDVRVHDLRHTYASWLVQAGVPLYEVQRILGHSSITTTQRYAHLAAGEFDRAMAAFEVADVGQTLGTTS